MYVLDVAWEKCQKMNSYNYSKNSKLVDVTIKRYNTFVVQFEVVSNGDRETMHNQETSLWSSEPVNYMNHDVVVNEVAGFCVPVDKGDLLSMSHAHGTILCFLMPGHWRKYKCYEK